MTLDDLIAKVRISNLVLIVIIDILSSRCNESASINFF